MISELHPNYFGDQMEFQDKRVRISRFSISKGDHTVFLTVALTQLQQCTGGSQAPASQILKVQVFKNPIKGHQAGPSSKGQGGFYLH